MHCRRGSGRSGLLAAGLLMRAGRPLDAAWRLVEQARGRPVPDTEEQCRYLARFFAASHTRDTNTSTL